MDTTLVTFVTLAAVSMAIVGQLAMVGYACSSLSYHRGFIVVSVLFAMAAVLLLSLYAAVVSDGLPLSALGGFLVSAPVWIISVEVGDNLERHRRGMKKTKKSPKGV